MLTRMRRAAAAIALSVPVLVTSPTGVHAIGLRAAACVVTGTATFQPSVTGIPQNVLADVTVTGTCATLQLSGSASSDVWGLPTASCELTEGFVQGAVSANPIGSVGVTGSYLGGPYTIHLVLDRLDTVDQTLVGTVDLVWADASSASGAIASVAADARCPLSGSSTVPVTGVLAYDA